MSTETLMIIHFQTEKERELMEVEERKRLEFTHYFEMQRELLSKTMLSQHRSPYGLAMNLGFPPHPFTAMFPPNLPTAGNPNLGLNLPHPASGLNLSSLGASIQTPFNVPPHPASASPLSVSSPSSSRYIGNFFYAIYRFFLAFRQHTFIEYFYQINQNENSKCQVRKIRSVLVIISKWLKMLNEP